MVLHRPVEAAPYIRTWPRREILLPTTLDSLLSSGNLLLQFFKLIQHDVDLRRCCLRLLGGFDHQKALAVSNSKGEVVSGTDAPADVGVMLPSTSRYCVIPVGTA
jgi:hypothetical protein